LTWQAKRAQVALSHFVVIGVGIISSVATQLALDCVHGLHYVVTSITKLHAI